MSAPHPMETERSIAEREISRIDGVSAAAVLSSGKGFQVQVFIRPKASETEVRRSIAQILGRLGLAPGNERVHVFSLAAEAQSEPGPVEPSPPAGALAGQAEGGTAEETEETFPVREEGPQPAPGAEPGDSDADARASVLPDHRPLLGRVVLKATGEIAQATVTLLLEGREVEEVGRAPRTDLNLAVAARTTLQALESLLGTDGAFALERVALFELFGLRVVGTLLRSPFEGWGPLLGTCVLEGRHPVEAAVRATLDAVNRQIALLSAS